MEKRLEWLDIAKGIAILLMVIGHGALPAVVGRWIYSFHMPLFFFASGLMLRPDNTDFIHFLRHEARKILYPYVVLSAVVMPLCFYFYRYTHWDERAITILWKGWQGNPLWFLPVFFMTRLLMYLACRNNRRVQYMLIAIGCLWIGSWLSSEQIHWIYSAPAVFFASVFGIMGYAVKGPLISLSHQKFGWRLIMPVMGMGLLGAWLSTFASLNMHQNRILPLYIIFPAAVCGILSVVVVSILLERVRITAVNRFFMFYGRHSLLVLAFSKPVMLLFIRMFGFSVTDIPFFSYLIKYIFVFSLLALLAYCTEKYAVLRWLTTLPGKRDTH